VAKEGGYSNLLLIVLRLFRFQRQISLSLFLVSFSSLIKTPKSSHQEGGPVANGGGYSNLLLIMLRLFRFCRQTSLWFPPPHS